MKYKTLAQLLLFSSFGVFAQQFKTEEPLYNHHGYSLSLSKGDLNNDGFEDLLVGGTSGEIVIYYNNGFGNFEQYKKLVNFNRPDLKLADLDEDGDLDILVISYSDQKAGWYENTGNGSFLQANYHVISNNTSYPLDPETGDLDNDGDLDIGFHPNGGYGCYIGINNGSGIFSSINLSSSTSIRTLDFGDIDGDGLNDVIGGVFGKLIWYKNNGSASFSASNIITTDIMGEYVKMLETFDIDNDGDEDIIYGGINYTNGSISSSELALFKSNGDGTFQEKIVIATNTLNTGELSQVDMDGDGDIDLLSNTISQNVLRWYENTECGDFQPHVIPSSLSKTKQIIGLDANNDGFTDIIANGDNNGLVVYLADGNGQFQENILNFNGVNSFPNDLESADIDNDGDLDVVSSFYSTYSIAWNPNSGNDKLEYQRNVSLGNGKSKAIAVADFNNDGKIDIASAKTDPNKIEWFKQENNVEFSNPINISTSVDDPTDLFAADLNADGFPDLISTSYEDGKVAWYKNNAGSFGNQIVLTSNAEGPQAVIAANLNNDTLPDILFVSSDDNKVAWYSNNGNNTFSSINTISTTDTAVTAVNVMDIDGDGNLDIITGSVINTKLNWYKNQGNGTFSSSSLIDEGIEFSNFSFDDIDKDGILDIVFASLLENKVFWIKNNGDETFENRSLISDQINSPSKVLLLDANLDGDIDVITAGYSDNEIYVSHNNYFTFDYQKFEACDTFITASGLTVTNSGEFLDTLDNSLGGDSIINYHLRISELDTTWLTKSICYGDTFKIDNTNYFSSGNYSKTLTNICGLDSLIYLNLAVNSNYDVYLTDTMCSNTCFNVGGTEYNSTGVYLDSLKSQCGFDSIIHTNLVVKEVSEWEITESICVGDTFFVGDNPFTYTGEFIAILENSVGCDSVVSLDLTAHFVNNIINRTGNTLVATTQAGATYQWINCADNSPISGETSNTFTPTTNGNFAVIITKETCERVSNCKEIMGIGLYENEINFNISPNPVKDNLHLNLNKIGGINDYITITDLIGKEVIRQNVSELNNISIKVEFLPTGIYLLNYYSDGLKTTQKFTKTSL